MLIVSSLASKKERESVNELVYTKNTKYRNCEVNKNTLKVEYTWFDGLHLSISQFVTQTKLISFLDFVRWQLSEPNVKKKWLP